MQNNLKEKGKILNHILYEMQMYLWSYNKQKISDNQYEFNSAWITHKVCLRNLISFFSIGEGNKPDEIIYNYFSFSEKLPDGKYQNRKKYKNEEGYISNSIMHITKDRITLTKQKTNIDEEIEKFEKKIFPKMYKYINNFIYKLYNENNIYYIQKNSNLKINITDELETPGIKNAISEVTRLLIDIGNKYLLFN